MPKPNGELFGAKDKGGMAIGCLHAELSFKDDGMMACHA